MSPAPRDEWFVRLLGTLLEGDPSVVALLANNPFPGAAPRYVRARYYRYTFTTPDVHRRTGAWWSREFVGEYVRPLAASMLR
jgi:hypothetical protein